MLDLVDGEQDHTYAIVSCTPGTASLFSIDANSGELKTVDSLDHETDAQYTLVIKIEDDDKDTPLSDTFTFYTHSIFYYYQYYFFLRFNVQIFSIFFTSSNGGRDAKRKNKRDGRLSRLRLRIQSQSVWIESMNTVMDANKMLTLVSNERIPLTNAMRMVFEIDSIDNGSPATVSRAGMTLFQP